MSTAVLGLDLNDHNTSAALVVDGEVVAASQEERFRREKRTRRFPEHALRDCLERGGRTLDELDAVAISVNPAIYLEHLQPAQSETIRYRGELMHAPLAFLLGREPGAGARDLHAVLDRADGGRLRVHYVTHHEAHAAVAFYPSPFDRAAVLTIDGFGEKETTVFFDAGGSRIERLSSVEFPHSVGCFYGALTEFLGLRPFRDEWKLMAAAAHGDPGPYGDALRGLVRRTGPGAFELELSHFNHYQFHRPRMFAPKLAGLLGPPYPPRAEPDRRFFDLAAATQAVTEEVVFALLGDLAERTGSDRLCLAGGVAYNCVLNGRIPARTPFREVFVPPMPDDSGTSIGAALRVAHVELGGAPRVPMVRNDLGPSFSEAQVEAELRRDRIRHERVDDAPAAAASSIAAGRLVGWFQGGMEFGDRALGHRSILADPRARASAERIDAEVKDRVGYQPFAPSVLAERAADWFELATPSPFMEKTVPVRPERRDRIPAVVGPDGSARVQTVTAAQNEPFHRLLTAFEQQTGVPLVLNTSFNRDEEPIVCTPADALRTFYTTGLDELFLGPFRICKDDGG